MAPLGKPHSSSGKSFIVVVVVVVVVFVVVCLSYLTPNQGKVISFIHPLTSALNQQIIFFFIIKY